MTIELDKLSPSATFVCSSCKQTLVHGDYTMPECCRADYDALEKQCTEGLGSIDE